VKPGAAEGEDAMHLAEEVEAEINIIPAEEGATQAARTTMGVVEAEQEVEVVATIKATTKATEISIKEVIKEVIEEEDIGAIGVSRGKNQNMFPVSFLSFIHSSIYWRTAPPLECRLN